MVKITSVCVFCGSSFGHADRYREEAARLGGLLAEQGITLIYGGGGVGLMGSIAQAALAAGGQVIGVIPRFLVRAELGVHSLTRLEVVDSMHERKERMFALSDAFIVLPGGMGTLDETLEILTWKLLALHDKPVVLVDLDGYWRPFAQLIDHVIAHGFAHAPARVAFRMTQSVDAALAEIAVARKPRIEPAAPEQL
ncbi:MAG TPA: TIGR00730 family Rossman fold protein [Alphaproteobacteria bacterium]|nr:TIGR00730 family Rossman fold protein [Alphaproteobacteria bacterium]